MRQLWFLLFLLPGFSQAEITVTDDAGEVVQLAAPPETIVSLSPHITEILFSLGVGERIVATVDFSDYPKAAKQIPRLGDAFSVSVEAVVALSPDLVVAWMTGGNARTFSQLKHLGYPVFINEAASLDGIADSVIRLGEVTGRAKQGRELASAFTEELAAIRSKYRESGTSVFFQIADAQLYTVSDRHLIGQAIKACGARNIFGDVSLPVPMVSFESIVAENPDLVVVSSPHSGYVSEWDSHWRSLGWNSRVRPIDASLITRPGLRMLEGVKILCETLKT